jgi:hypothetical protein
MAKDRFSKFKKSFYSNEFRYGSDTLFEKNKSYTIKRLSLSDTEKHRLKTLKKKKLNEWELNFVKSLIHANKSFTLKQKEVIIKLENKYK